MWEYTECFDNEIEEEEEKTYELRKDTEKIINEDIYLPCHSFFPSHGNITKM